MQIFFTGRNLEVTSALKTYAEDKLRRLSHRYNHIETIKVIFLIEKLTHIAEANVHFDGSDIHGKAESEDMYSAIDKLIDKLDAQLTKHKEKNTDH